MTDPAELRPCSPGFRLNASRLGSTKNSWQESSQGSLDPRYGFRVPTSEDHAYRPAKIDVEGKPAINRNPDASTMRGVAHPLRLRMLEILRAGGRPQPPRWPSGSGCTPGARAGTCRSSPSTDTSKRSWTRAPAVSGGGARSEYRCEYAEAMEAGEEQAAATTEFLSLTLRLESGRAQAFLRQDWEFDW